MTTPHLEVIAGGPLLTVQDLGRPNARRYGVPSGGAMDTFALSAANLLVGNPPNTAALELTAGGVLLRIGRPTLLALCGADLGASLNERPLPLWTSVAAEAGDHLRLGGRPAGLGARAYLAIAGGIAVPPVLGSRSTNLAGGFGGLAGRPLRAGDQLSAAAIAPHPAPRIGRFWPAEQRPAYSAEPTLRFIRGPHLASLADDTLEQLTTTRLQVNATSNRMGYRLDGLRLPHPQPISIASLGVIPGVIQIPPDGTPILLMADAQTTGGYPVAGVVIGADLPLAAQLLPGDYLRLRQSSPAEARSLLAAQQALLAHGPHPADEGEPLAALAGAPALMPEG